MKRFRRCTRRFILSLLAISVFLPIFLLSGKHLHLISHGSTGKFEDLPAIKYRNDYAINLRALDEEEDKSVNEPPSLVYKDRNSGLKVTASVVDVKFESSRGGITLSEKKGDNSGTLEDNGRKRKTENSSSLSGGKEEHNEEMVQHDRKVQSLSRRVIDEKVKEMKDQVIRARAYLNFAPPNSNSHFVKELKLRIKDLERALGDSTKDSDLSKRALLRSKAMEGTLTKANHIYPDCPAMVKKLRAMEYNAEEQVRAQKNQATFLVQLAGRTTPKGLHCLSMRLTADYFALPPEKRNLPSPQDLLDTDSYHFAVFSDNVVACHVVVQSTLFNAKKPERIIFHVVTDALNYPAISMWFLLYPPGKATIEVQSIESFNQLSSKFDITMQKENSPDTRYTSALNHLRFYLPDMFPKLHKIVLLDHDVVVQRDITRLFSIDMKGKVNGAVETCQVDSPSFRRMDTLVNFSDPMVAKKFSVKACTWAFGMNIFDLQKWRRHSLTRDYEKYLQLGKKRPLWKAGSLPLGWVTFYNQTVALDSRWHVLGLGSHSGVRQADINQGAVIHYDGVMKPWLDIGFEKYKRYWRKHVNYSHPFLQQCNIHE